MGFCYCNDGCVLCDPSLLEECPNCEAMREDIEVLRQMLKEAESKNHTQEK